MNDANKRILWKTLTWRLTGSTATFIIAFILTERIDVASGIFALQFIVNTILYWIHEKIWTHIGDKNDGMD